MREAAPLPDRLTAWRDEAPSIRYRLEKLLGERPAAFTPEIEITAQRDEDGYRAEEWRFVNGLGDTVYGTLLIPQPIRSPAPAVLYGHIHGAKYGLGRRELFRERDDGEPLGVRLVRSGYVVLSIDAYAFGARQHQGPLGEREGGAATESALFKHFLWRGQTLWGMMLHDDQLALNALVARDEVDAERMAIIGMSLGGSRATWLSALDERPALTIPIAQMTRYRDFAATGAYNLHSIYYYVPGLLASSLDMEHLVALSAPRRQHILIGAADPLSPMAGVHKIAETARGIYALYGAEDRFQVTLYPGVAHAFTSAMVDDLLHTLKTHL